ncbi:hypothetical protein [Sulfitobacter sp. SK011]|nr:hypothetical protein [Sulfitobacter sp. SK011]
MQRRKQIHTQRLSQPSGYPNSIARQVFERILNAIRQSIEIQMKVSQYH